MSLKFNINENVRVKLTDYGREMLKKDHEEFWNMVQTLGGRPNVLIEYVPPVEDDDGWSTWQMWCLMKNLGQYVGMATKNPFELTIEIGE